MTGSELVVDGGTTQLYEAVRDNEGNFTLKTVATALNANQDVYHDRCPMKW